MSENRRGHVETMALRNAFTELEKCVADWCRVYPRHKEEIDHMAEWTAEYVHKAALIGSAWAPEE